jgi:hypothetical protein
LVIDADAHFVPEYGRSYTLIAADDISGSFTSVEFPSGIPMEISYGPTSVSITVVPESGHLGLVIGGQFLG